MKTCFKCHQVKPLSEFYKHPQMADGHVGKCKDCNCRDVQENRLKKIDFYTAYEAKRNSTKERKSQRAAHYKKRSAEDPNFSKAHRALKYALRTKKIERPGFCTKCHMACIPHGHHPDYSKPLDVMWLCPKCHHAQHVIEGKIKTRARIKAE